MTNVQLSSELTVQLIDYMGSDESVARAAWVSTLGEEVVGREPTSERVGGLIDFLMRNRHGTPFEHNAFTFFVKAPIAVFREFHRHRIGFSYNEQSGRYSQLKPEFYAPMRGRPLVQVGKAGHYTFEMGSNSDHEKLITVMGTQFQQAYDAYEDLLAAGIAKEVARGVLPVYIYSSMYVTCNARSLMSFLSLRTRNDDATFPSFPMWEIEQVAKQMAIEFENITPLTYAAFRSRGSVAP